MVFHDSFHQHAPDAAPGEPWTLIHDGAGIGEIKVRPDADNRFGKGTQNAFLEYRKDGTGGAMALRSIGTIGAVVSTFSIRYLESADFQDFTWLILYAGSRSTANRAQVINFGQEGHLGDLAERGVVNQVDLIVNNGDVPVSYHGIYTVAPGCVDLWVNGRPARWSFSSQNNRRGPVTGFEFNTSGTRTQTLLIDELVIRDHPRVTGFQQGSRPFDHWRKAHFTPLELEMESISGPLGDAAGDGIANLHTYAFQLDPRVSASRQVLPMAVRNGAGLKLAYTRVKDAFDLRYVVEASDNLRDWVSGNGFLEEIDIIDHGDTERIVVLDRASQNGEPEQRFLRIRVELADAPPPGELFQNLGPPMETAPIQIESVTVNESGQTIAWGTLTDPDRFAVGGVDVATGQQFVINLESHGRSNQIRVNRGQSGHLYIYAGNAARFFKYDINEHRLTDLGRPASPARYISGHAVGPDGRFYVGSYPATHLVSVDTVTDQIRHHGAITADDRLKYIIRPAVSDDNIVFVPVGLHHAELWALNPVSGVKNQILPPEMMEQQGFTAIFVAEDGQVYGEAFGRKFRCSPDRIEYMDHLPNARVDRSQITAAGWEHREIDPLGNLVSIHSLNGAELFLPTELRGQGVLIFSIGGADAQGRIWGGGWSPSRTWTYNPRTGQARDWGKFVHPNTQVEATLIHSRGIFLSSYLGAHLDFLDPATETRTHITSFHHSHGQERLPWLVTGNDGMIYGPLQPVKGHLEGGIVRLDPQTFARQAWIGFLEHLAPTTLAAVPGTSLLAGGTTVQGSTGAIPIRDEAVLFLWDTERNEVAWEAAILPGEKRYRVMRGNDGLIYGITGGKYFVFDATTRSLLRAGDLPENEGFTDRVRLAKQPCGPDGLIVGLMKGLVFAIDPADHSIRVLARHPSIMEDKHETLHSTRAIWASPEGMLYYGAGADLWKFDTTRR